VILDVDRIKWNAVIHGAKESHASFEAAPGRHWIESPSELLSE
jgi:hypothetical protein